MVNSCSGKSNTNLVPIKQGKADWIGHILHMNCVIKHVTRGKLEGAGRRRRRHKQLLKDSKQTNGYWKLKEKVPDRSLWARLWTDRNRDYVMMTGRDFVTSWDAYFLVKNFFQ